MRHHLTTVLCSVVLYALCAIAPSACGGADQPAPVGPNILVIVADDLGFADVGSGIAGSGAASSGLRDAPRTPRLDALLAESARPRTYRTAPCCTPARAGLLTGVDPGKLGLWKNLSARDGGGLRASATTLAEHLQAAGWSTTLIGKWHLGHERAESRPLAQGFERFRGVLGGWIDPQTRRRGAEPDWWRDEAQVEQLGYAPQMMVEEARRALRERDPNKPFFLWFASTLPHTPLHAPPGVQLDPQSPNLNRDAMRAMVEALDAQVGALLDELDQQQVARDTIVVFVSDNGGDREYSADNGTLREGKFTAYEGGVRTHCAVRWPARVAAGERALDLSYLDLTPTVCALARVPAQGHSFDGRDVSAALLEGAAVAALPQRYVCERVDERRACVVEGDRKLVRVVSRTGLRSTLLFDLAADPTERVELYPADDPRTPLWLQMLADLEAWR